MKISKGLRKKLVENYKEQMLDLIMSEGIKEIEAWISDVMENGYHAIDSLCNADLICCVTCLVNDYSDLFVKFDLSNQQAKIVWKLLGNAPIEAKARREIEKEYDYLKEKRKAAKAGNLARV